ncbi:alpha-L-fucosidase [Pelagicoccus sp. SDUM812005]|uniref:alpha-L-fucosidase n=1 Tax=Pelagicoccus sp. SDUM812005 TaxID=3041257 RepID=UPI00280F2924|nr:alpha-L-fucosidase [Pelagicoccus sp. SDUM812005]MDQ8183792.1 alpha-L-fucosidase [Pelagicoccus sp. SDUM812005]
MNILILFSACVLGMLCVTLELEAREYEPTRESLSGYEVPEWYHDAKIGFFYHWGPQSVVGEYWNRDVMEFCRQQGRYAGSHTAARNPPGQWGANMYPKAGKPENEQNSNYLLHKRFFGDPKEFGYKDLIPLMSSDGFDYKEMVRLLDEAGVRYFAPMAIHHDGFAMWDSEVVDEFNAAKMGPKLDTVEAVVGEARKRGIKVGVSTHVARHSWYYGGKGLRGYDVSDPRYVQLYGEGIGEGGLPKPSALKKWEDTLSELVHRFQPDYIFVDGGTADIFCDTGNYVHQDAFRRIVANYYNDGLKNGYEPVISYKRESLWKEEAIPDYEGGNLVGIAPYKWQAHSNVAGWFYRPGQSVVKSHILFRKTIDVVSKNGNMLLNLGLKGDGSMQDADIAFLKDLATWTKALGEGIFETRPWLVYGEDSQGKPKPVVENGFRGIVYDDPSRTSSARVKLIGGDLRYTKSKNGRVIYGTILAWPKESIVLRSFGRDGVGKDLKVAKVSLLGSDEKIVWKQTAKGIEIQAPRNPVFENLDWPVMFKLEL